MSATRSPCSMPAAISALASSTTWSRNSEAVTAAQPAVLDLRRMTTAPGSCSARLKTVSGRLAEAGTSTSTGTLYSRTNQLLFGGPPGRYRVELPTGRGHSHASSRSHRISRMRVHVISDVHGRADALARAGDGADALICLGDLLLFIDYADHAQGIFPRPVRRRRGAPVRRAAHGPALRRGPRAVGRGCGPPSTATRASRIERGGTRAVRGALRRLARPRLPHLRQRGRAAPVGRATSGTAMRVLDGEVVEIGGWRFGFVGGGLPSPYRTPYEVADEEYAAKVEAVGEVDVLCCHIPPAVPELLYDVVARRFERGSEATLAAIRRRSRASPCSGTCTSRCSSGPVSAAPSASTSAISGDGASVVLTGERRYGWSAWPTSPPTSSITIARRPAADHGRHRRLRGLPGVGRPGEEGRGPRPPAPTAGPSRCASSSTPA